MRYRWTDHLNELGVRSYLTPSNAHIASDVWLASLAASSSLQAEGGLH
jgi:hypothetical protein